MRLQKQEEDEKFVGYTTELARIDTGIQLAKRIVTDYKTKANAVPEPYYVYQTFKQKFNYALNAYEEIEGSIVEVKKEDFGAIPNFSNEFAPVGTPLYFETIDFLNQALNKGLVTLRNPLEPVVEVKAEPVVAKVIGGKKG